MKFKFHEKTLEIDGRSFKFDQDIVQVLQRGDDRVIIRLEGADFKPDDPNVGRNVFSLDRHGKMVWRIETSGFHIRTEDGRKIPRGWHNIHFRENGKVMLIDSAGFEWRLNPDTGEVSDPVFVK